MTQGPGYEYRENTAHFDAQARMGHLGAYYAWVLDLFGGGIAFPAADAGAGSGHFASLLRQRGGPLVLLEGGADNLAQLEARFAGDDLVEVVDCDLEACGPLLAGHGVRSVFSLDVLEHLPDDARLLAQIHGALPPGGRLYIKVPALPALFGTVDVASGHYRRYTRTSLRAAVAGAGFHVERCHYMNLAGVVPYFVKSRLLRRASNFSRTFSPAAIARIQRAIPWIRRIDRVTGAPLGLSVVCVATRAA